MAAEPAARRYTTLVVPLAVNAAMPMVFRRLAHRLGPRRGYIAGFAVYWATCAVIPAAILGPRRAATLLHDARRPGLLEALALALPPVGGLATEALPAVRAGVRVDAPLLATAAGFAVTNAVAEELLWRGLFLAVFPQDRPACRVYAAAGFGLWHLAPQQVHPSRQPLAFCAAAAVLGLINGWATGRLGGIRAVSVWHALADATGLRSFATMLGR